jgi:hypothetical protein
MKFDDIVFCRKGTHPRKKKRLLGGIPYSLSDNSIFNIKLKNEMNEHAKKICPERSFDGFEGKGYTKWYDFCFQNIKNEKLDIVEFSVSNQDSLGIWEKYFKNSSVVGISGSKDIKSSMSIPEDGLDIIIDNGSHSQDRIDIFEEVFDKLNPGGIYIFENLRQGYKDNKNCVVEYLKEKLDSINLHGRNDYPNYEQFVYNENDKMGHYEKRIASIQFYFDVCIIFKRYCR